MDIDLLFLSRDLSPPRPDVWEGIQAQEGVTLRVIRITGPAVPGDRSRFETIVRARNAGKRQGSAPLVMLLDDDVVLGPRCVARLAEGLINRPEFAALAADSGGEMNDGRDHWDYPRHVGMAAVLFRRERLEALTFRWEPTKCECQCCCDDLHRAGYAIGYMPGAEAWHRPSPKTALPADAGVSPHCNQPHQEPQLTVPARPPVHRRSRDGSWPPLTQNTSVSSSGGSCGPARRGQPRDGHGRHVGPPTERAEDSGPQAGRRGLRRPQ